MAGADRIIRLFISSTFADFALERDILQREVFPDIRTLCLENGFRFQPIDLRWGVSEEAGDDGRTLSICFEEIRRCQRLSPDLNFLILLGDRYGSRILPDTIPSPEYAALEPYLSDADRTLLQRLYGEDRNFIKLDALGRLIEAPEYVPIPDARASATNEDIQRLLAALIDATQQARFSPSRALAYAGSATHQEVQRGLLDDMCDPASVLCVFRALEWEGDPPTSSNYIEHEQDGRKRLTVLKRNIEARLGRPIEPYSARWDSDRQELALDRDGLRERLHAALEQRVREVLQSAQASASITMANTQFEAERTDHFIGRHRELEDISTYCAATDTRKPPLIVTGARGSGKSGLLAQATIHARATQPHAVVVSQYIGITPNSSTLRDLLASMWREIAQAYGAHEPALPVDAARLISDFAEAFRYATAAQPLIVFIDGIDQLGAQAQRMEWLPARLPASVSLILSIVDTRPELQTLQVREPSPRTLLLGALNTHEAGELLDGWLHERGRTLEARQRVAVLKGFAAAPTPLYLRVAMEEAARWHSFDSPESPLPATVEDLLQQIVGRLAEHRNHGPALTHSALGYLAAAKHGMTEDELLDLLAQNTEVRGEQAGVRESPEQTGADSRSAQIRQVRPEIDPRLPLPVVLWARLYADIEPYLSRREADRTQVITFYHQQLAEVASASAGRWRNQELASYFARQPRLHGAQLNSRRLSELPYQQACSIPEYPYRSPGDQLERPLLMTLTDAQFLEDKIADQGVGAALDDLAFLKDYERIQTISGAIRAGAAVLQRKPDELVNQLQGRIGNVKPLQNIPADRLALRLRFPSLAADPALIEILSGHSGAVNACAFHPNGDRVLSAASDKTLRLWDVESGETIRVFGGYPSDVTACAIHPSRHECASGYRDGAIQIWDMDTGDLLHALPGHAAKVTACVFNAEGTLMLSSSRDSTVRVWNTSAWQLEDTFTDSSIVGGQNDCAFSPAGDLVLSASDSGQLQVWDLRTHTAVSAFGGAQRPMLSCAFHRDGKRVLGGSITGALGIWDLTTGEPVLPPLSGHRSGVSGCAFSPDGALALSAARDNTLRVWDCTTGECVGLFKGHADQLSGCAFSPDGRLALSASDDTTLRVWNVAKRRSPFLLFQGQTGVVSACAFGPTVAPRRPKSAEPSPFEPYIREPNPFERHTPYRDPIKGGLAITGSDDSNLFIWSTETGQMLRRLRGHGDVITVCAISQDGQHILSASEDSTIVEWEAATGKAIRLLKTGASIARGAFSADGKWALCAPQYGDSITVWDILGERLAATLDGLRDRVESCALSSDGSLAAVVSNSNTIQVWRHLAHESLPTFEAQTGTLHGCAISPDGRHILTTSAFEVADSAKGGDTRITRASKYLLLEVATGDLIRAFDPRAEVIQDFAYSPDGRFVVDVSREGRLTLWSVESGAVICSWLVEAVLTSCAFAPDGSHVMAGDTGGGVHFLELDHVIDPSLEPSRLDQSLPASEVTDTHADKPQRRHWWQR